MFAFTNEMANKFSSYWKFWKVKYLDVQFQQKMRKFHCSNIKILLKVFKFQFYI